MKKILITSVAMLVMQTGFAASQEPTSCPTISAINSVGVSSAWQDPEKGTWVGIEWKNSFNTDFDWSFGVGEFYSDTGDVKEILAQANKAISSLTAASGPTRMSDDDSDPSWVCMYSGSRGIYGIAMTPSVSPQFVIKTMKSVRR